MKCYHFWQRELKDYCTEVYKTSYCNVCYLALINIPSDIFILIIDCFQDRETPVTHVSNAGHF